MTEKSEGRESLAFRFGRFVGRNLPSVRRHRKRLRRLDEEGSDMLRKISDADSAERAGRVWRRSVDRLAQIADER